MTGRKEPRRPRIRRTWTRNPAQRAHSTPKGAKGYARSREREIVREEVRVRLHQAHRRPTRIVVLLSGEGRELNMILSDIDNRLIDGEIAAVIADEAGAEGIGIASKRGIRTAIVDPAGFPDAAAFNREINDIVDRLNPDVIVLDGFRCSVRLTERRNRQITDRAEALLHIAATD